MSEQSLIVPVLSPVAEVGTLPFLKQSAHPIFAHGERESRGMRGQRRLRLFWSINLKKHIEWVSSGVSNSCKIIIVSRI